MDSAPLEKLEKSDTLRPKSPNALQKGIGRDRELPASFFQTRISLDFSNETGFQNQESRKRFLSDSFAHSFASPIGIVGSVGVNDHRLVGGSEYDANNGFDNAINAVNGNDQISGNFETFYATAAAATATVQNTHHTLPNSNHSSPNNNINLNGGKKIIHTADTADYNNFDPDTGKRIPRIRAGSLSVPASLFGNSMFPNVWTPINSNHDVVDQLSPYSYTDRFAPAVEETDDINAFSRTIGYLGIDDPLNDAVESNPEYLNARRHSDAFRPRSVSGSFPSFENDEKSQYAGRTISSMAVMTDFSGDNNLGGVKAIEPFQDMVEKFQLDSGLYTDSFPEPSDENVSLDCNSLEHSHPSRSLWIGNIDATLGVEDLTLVFSCFGEIESVRILPEKECAFINYLHLKDALEAREQMQGGKIGNCVVRIGFGKNEALLEAQGTNPTKSLWVGNIFSSTKPADLESIFSQYGKIESARVLTHKNCGFVNFVSLADAIVARDELNGREICGSPVKIGFAKVPQKVEMLTASQALASPSIVSSLTSGALNRATQNAWQAKTLQQPTPGTYEARAVGSTTSDGSIQEPGTYYQRGENINQTNSTRLVKKGPILPIPDLKVGRKHDQNRLREMRKRLESHIPANEVYKIFTEIIPDADDLCSDYIGNVVIQKVMENATDSQRLSLIQKISPKMAALGIHKNGTWAVQKIIDITKNPEHIMVIVEALRPYTSALMLDQFGNYVIQCCLRLGSEWSQFIFDTITFNIVEIGQGRFGARATRACLESQHASKELKMQVSYSIVRNCVQLSSNSNGAILLTWFFDNSDSIMPVTQVMIPHTAFLACHKLSSTFLLKIVNQTNEMDARQLVISEIFKESILAQILGDQIVGIPFITKIFALLPMGKEKEDIVDKVRYHLSSIRQKNETSLNYKRLMEELNSSRESGSESPRYFRTTSTSNARSGGKEKRSPWLPTPLSSPSYNK